MVGITKDIKKMKNVNAKRQASTDTKRSINNSKKSFNIALSKQKTYSDNVYIQRAAPRSKLEAACNKQCSHTEANNFILAHPLSIVYTFST